MSETFKYPDAIAPTKTLTFEKAAGTDGHLLTDQFSRRLNQLMDETVSGIRMVKNLGEHFDRWEYTVIVPLSSGSYTDWDDILEFFGESYTNGGVNTFVWTDYGSVERTVQLVSMDIGREMVSATLIKVSVTIEEVNS